MLRRALGFELEATRAMIHNWLPQEPAYSKVLCTECWETLASASPLLGFYRHGEENSFAIVSGAPYIGDLRELIHRLKYSGDRLLAADLTAIMLNAWRMGSIFLTKKNVILVPVPLYWRRRMERGFNQAELLACEASKILKIEVAPKALRRRRATTPQQKLEKTQRFKNVEGAFVGDPRQLKGRAVVIIDDVCTSGATLAECVKEVTRCGATQVVALTVARTVLRKSERSSLRSIRADKR